MNFCRRRRPKHSEAPSPVSSAARSLERGRRQPTCRMVGIFVRNVHPSWTLNYSQWNVIISAAETNLQPAVSEAGEESAIWTKLWMTNVQAQFGARKTEELFGRRGFIDRVLQEAFTCRRGRWIDALPRCVGYPFVPFVCAGKVNEASAAACNARFRKIISAAAC